MSIWTSKAVIFGLAAMLLAACSDANGLPFAADLGALGGEVDKERIAQVQLAGGAITLAAPNGYCIDRRSLKRSPQSGFAVMARCDTLGVGGFYDAFDLAIITVTTVPQPADTGAPDAAAVARSAGGAKVLADQSQEGLSLVRLGGAQTALQGVSRIHWRGAFLLNGHLVGIGLYAPEGSAALTRDGAALLDDLTRRTRRASAGQTHAKAKPKN